VRLGILLDAEKVRGREGKFLFVFRVLHTSQHSRQARNNSEKKKKMKS